MRICITLRKLTNVWEGTIAQAAKRKHYCFFSCRLRFNAASFSLVKDAMTTVQLGLTLFSSLESLDWYKIDLCWIFHCIFLPTLSFQVSKEVDFWWEMWRIRGYWDGFNIVSQKHGDGFGLVGEECVLGITKLLKTNKPSSFIILKSYILKQRSCCN